MRVRVRVRGRVSLEQVIELAQLRQVGADVVPQHIDRDLYLVAIRQRLEGALLVRGRVRAGVRGRVRVRVRVRGRVGVRVALSLTMICERGARYLPQ